MGFFGDVANRVRDYFRRDKEQVGLELAKGATASGYPTTGYDLLQAYGYDVLSDFLKLEHDLLSRYIDYEEMDDYPEIAAAIDIYADDASQPETHMSRSLWVTSRDETVGQILDDLFHRQLRMDEEIWEIARTLTKYGNDFEEILVSNEGVRGLNFLAPPTVRRIEGPRGELFGFVQDFKGRFGYCLARGSRVWSPSGLQEIQDFSATSVLGYKDGKAVPFRLQQRHANGTKKVFRLRTRHREVYLTEDHPVLAERPDGVRSWVKVKDLKIVRYEGYKRNIDYSRSDKLIICTQMPQGEVPNWASVWKFDPFETRWGNKGSPKTITLPTRPSPEFCRLFGFLLGDGWTEGMSEGGSVDEPYQHKHHKGENYESDPSSTPRVSYARGVYPELNDLYDGLLASLGLEVKVNEEGTQSRVNSVQFVRLLHALGWIDGAENKRVPSWIFSLPTEHREAFLAGFIDADGWDTQTNAGLKGHHFEIANYNLTRDLKNLIDGLGYRSGNIGRRQREPGTIVTNKKTGRTVTIATQEPCFNLHYSLNKFEHPFVAENLIEVSYHEDAEVFDLEVADEAHNFVADGVVVHNSPAEFQQIMSNRAAMRQGGNDKAGMGGMEKISALEDWEVVHFRLRGKHRRSIYGYSVLEPARWIWKRLMLLEDAALIYRLQRAPERYAFYVDVGDLPPQEAHAYLNRVRQQHRKKKWVNPTTGKLDLKFDPMAQDEDFFIPVRQGSEGTRIEVLGAPSWQHMEDVEYFRDKLFAAIKVPKAYLAQTEGINRSILSSEDVRFARTVLRVQRELRNGLSKIARVHLAALNVDPQAVEYNIHLTIPSAIFELAQLEVKNARADLAGRMQEFVSKHWLMSNVFGMSDDEILTIFRERDEDAQREAYMQANAQSLLQKAVASAGIEGQAIGQVDAQNITQAETPPEQLKAAQQQQQAAAAGPAGTSKPQESSIRGPLILIKPPMPKRTYYDRERQLFEGGNKESEKRAEEKLDKLLRSDRVRTEKLGELGDMLRELSRAVGDPRGDTRRR